MYFITMYFMDRMLIKLSRSCTDDLRQTHYKDTACSLFFHLAESFNHDIQFYPPTKQFFTACMDMLGNVSTISKFRFYSNNVRYEDINIKKILV